MAEILALEGRVLFLSEDLALIEAQLAGRDLSRAEAGKLRDDVSTDEIPRPPPACCTDALKGVFCVAASAIGGRLMSFEELIARLSLASPRGFEPRLPP